MMIWSESVRASSRDSVYEVWGYMSLVGASCAVLR